MAFWIAVIVLPFVGGLHNYAMDYGYRGYSRRAAFGNAWRVALVLAGISAAVAWCHGV